MPACPGRSAGCAALAAAPACSCPRPSPRPLPRPAPPQEGGAAGGHPRPAPGPVEDHQRGEGHVWACWEGQPSAGVTRQGRPGVRRERRAWASFPGERAATCSPALTQQRNSLPRHPAAARGPYRQQDGGQACRGSRRRRRGRLLCPRPGPCARAGAHHPARHSRRGFQEQRRFPGRGVGLVGQEPVRGSAQAELAACAACRHRLPGRRRAGHAPAAQPNPVCLLYVCGTPRPPGGRAAV